MKRELEGISRMKILSMKVTLNIKDEEAEKVLALLRDLPYVEIEEWSPEKIRILKEVKEAVDEMNRVKRGESKARPIEELLDEL